MRELDKYIKDQVGKTQFEVDPDHLHDIETRLKKRRRNPFFFWLFSGIAVMAILGAFIIFISRQENDIIGKEHLEQDITKGFNAKEIVINESDRSGQDLEDERELETISSSVSESITVKEEKSNTSMDGISSIEMNRGKDDQLEIVKGQDPIIPTNRERVYHESEINIETIAESKVDKAGTSSDSERIDFEKEKTKPIDAVYVPIQYLKTLIFNVYPIQSDTIDIADEVHLARIEQSVNNKSRPDIIHPIIAFGPAINLEYFPSLFYQNVEGQKPVGYYVGVKMRYLAWEKTYIEAGGYYGERTGGFIYEKSAENDFAGLRSRTPRNSLELKTLRYFRLDLDGIYTVRQHELIGGIGMKLLHGGKGDATYHIQGLSNEIEQILISDQWLETYGLRKFLPDLHVGYAYQFDFGLNIRLDARAHWTKHNFPNLNADERFLYRQEFNWIYPSITMSYLFSKK